MTTDGEVAVTLSGSDTDKIAFQFRSHIPVVYAENEWDCVDEEST